MIALVERTHLRWWVAGICLALLAGCKAPRPIATEPLWQVVDESHTNPDSLPQQVDQSGNSWQSSGSSTDDYQLSLLDHTGELRWELPMGDSTRLMSPSGDNMIVLTQDMNLNKVSADGNIVWQAPSLPAGQYWGLTLNVASDGDVLLSGRLDDFIYAIALDSDGQLVWQHQFAVTANTYATSLVKTASGRWLLLDSGNNGTHNLYRISDNGLQIESVALTPEVQALYSARMKATSNGVYVFSWQGLAGLDAEGEFAWFYKPDGLAGGLLCSNPIDAGIACGHITQSLADTTIVERIAPDGTVLLSNSYPLLTGMDGLYWFDDGRLVVRSVSMSTITDNLDSYLRLFQLTYTGYRTHYLQVTDNAGVMTTNITLAPKQMLLPKRPLYPPYYFSWEATNEPYYTDQSIGLRDNILIVAGVLTQSAPSGSTDRGNNNYVTAYPIDVDVKVTSQ